MRELERFLLELGTDFSFIASPEAHDHLPQMDRGEIRVAEYLVELPPREILEAKLHEAMRLARGQVKEGTETYNELYSKIS